MRLGVAGKHRRRLARGAALVVLGGLAAGCSSDVTRFQDSLVTGSAQAPARAAPDNQPYPGDVDRTYTGTVAAQQPAQTQGGGILRRAGLLPRPAENVGGGTSLASSAGQAAPQQQTYAASSGAMSAGPALAPVTRSQLNTTMTSTAPVVQQAQPVQQQAQQIQQPRAAGWSADGGSQVTVRQGDTVATLSRRFNVPEDAIRRANGLSGNEQLAAGRSIVIPTFSQAGQPPSAPQPQQQEPNQLAVLPQQPKPQDRETGTFGMPSSTASSDSAPAPGGTYKVVAGDTLSGISRRSGVSVEALKNANGLSNGLIRIGQEITIPAGGQMPAQTQTAETRTPSAPVDPVVTSTATAESRQETASAYTPPVTSGQQIETAALNTEEIAPTATGATGMRWPVRGRIISGFGTTSGGKTNDGIDISVPEGTSVRAAENGVVIYAGDGLREFGNTVLVRHDDGLVTVYGHNSRITVSRGDTVRRGQEIALSGTSGSAETPRLHFEVRKDSTPVDPTTFLE